MARRTFTVPAVGTPGPGYATDINSDLTAAVVDSRGPHLADWGGYPKGAGHDGNITAALTEALADLMVDSVGGRPLAQHLQLEDGYHFADDGFDLPGPISLGGRTRYGARMFITDLYPPGKRFFNCARIPGVSVLLAEENHVPGHQFTNLCIDGNGRRVAAGPVFGYTHADRGQIRDVLVRNWRGSVIQGWSWRESQIYGLNTWLCGSPTAAVLDLFDQTVPGTGDGNNLVQFFGCQFALNCGDHFDIGSDSAAVIVREISFDAFCIFHGLNEWIDAWPDNCGHDLDGAPIELEMEGGYTPTFRVRNARGITMHAYANLPGRGQPLISLQRSALGNASINQMLWYAGTPSGRGGYSPRFFDTVDTGTDAAHVLDDAGHQRHHLSTGSRVTASIAAPGVLPAPLAPATDYFAIVVDEGHVKLATTRANAIGGVAIDLTAAATGLFALTQQDTEVAAVNAGADTLASVNHRYSTEARVQFATDGALPAPLVALTDYFLIRVDKDTLKVAATRQDAELGNAIDLTDAGAGNLWFTPQEFMAYIGIGTLEMGHSTAPQGLPSRLPNRAWARIEKPYGQFIPALGMLWPRQAGLPAIAEYSDGGDLTTNLFGSIVLAQNNRALWTVDPSGAFNQALRHLSNGVVGIGNVAGAAESVQVFAGIGKLLQLYVGATKAVDISETGISFMGKTPRQAPRALAPDAVDLATAQTLINDVKALLIQYGLGL